MCIWWGTSRSVVREGEITSEGDHSAEGHCSPNRDQLVAVFPFCCGMGRSTCASCGNSPTRTGLTGPCALAKIGQRCLAHSGPAKIQVKRVDGTSAVPVSLHDRIRHDHVPQQNRVITAQCFVGQFAAEPKLHAPNGVFTRGAFTVRPANCTGMVSFTLHRRRVPCTDL